MADKLLLLQVEKSFWSEFWASSGVFMLGEANNGDRTCYTGGYQGPLPSVLNFPLYWAMRRAFNERQPMTEISKSLEAQVGQSHTNVFSLTFMRINRNYCLGQIIRGSLSRD